MLVFVYGTLKNGCINNGILKNLSAQFLFPAETIQKYPMYLSEDMMEYFPYLENQPGIGNIIQGEVWDLPHQNIEELDYFEGVPDLYIQGSIKVEFEKNIYDCLCYFKSEKSDPLDVQTKDLIDEWDEWGD